MGTVRLVLDDEVLELPLGASTRIGRHWSSDGIVPMPAAPLYWLEVRWRTDHWSWRPLGAAERTRGTGAVESGGFRSWAAGEGRVRLDGCGCAVELLLADAGAPELMVEDLDTGKRMLGTSLERHLEVWHDGRAWPLGVDPASEPPLRDGSVFVRSGRAFRLHCPLGARDTADIRLDAHDPDLVVTVDLGSLQACFTSNGREAIVAGECVRVLAVYAAARMQDADGGGGGWVPAAAAHAAWLELGGRASSPIDRLAWERGKLRSRLAAQGMSGLESLFATRRGAGHTEVRLSTDPSNIEVEGSA